MPVTDKDCPRDISRPWQQSLYYRRIRRDSRPALQPLKWFGPPRGKFRVAEKWRSQESVTSVLNENPGGAQISDGDDLVSITTIAGCAADGVRCRNNLVPDDVWAPATRDDDQCARQNPELGRGGASHRLRVLAQSELRQQLAEAWIITNDVVHRRSKAEPQSAIALVVSLSEPMKSQVAL